MNCRVCGHDLETILDLGNQCLSGQFPKIGEPDPPRFPLVLARCVQCSLIQLRDTVDPALMFTHYGYRSNVTKTMNAHLHAMSGEALKQAGLYDKKGGAVLDIGCNDGTLLSYIERTRLRIGVDPSNVPFMPTEVDDIRGSGPVGQAATIVRGFYPHPELSGIQFNLIFSIACFYDVNDPVAFTCAVRDNLAPGGLWCCEVSDVRSVLAGAWDSICHEHVCYYSPADLIKIAQQAGLYLAKEEHNFCNGGSVRCYFAAEQCASLFAYFAPQIGNFAARVHASSACLRDYLHSCRQHGARVHLLGASTKANTVLQFCCITPDLVQYASDRDPHKHGCCTPGTRIPIISEEESRVMKPDVYLCLLHGLKDEVIARETAFLDGGGTILFPLPKFEEIKR